MKLISWNVNGLRAVVKKEYWSWWLDVSPDIFCIQETKCSPDQLPPEITNIPGYHSYFSWPTVKKGYSGVAVYAKNEPKAVSYGLGSKEFDQEGRLITLDYGDLAVCNVYFPNGGGGPERLEYKLKYYDLFLEYIDNLRKSGKKIIFTGDINTAHEEIDLARPKQNETNTGFLPIERKWIDKVVEHGYVDIFRHMYPKLDGAYTYWDMKTLARNRNVGWRIDYFFVSEDLVKDVKETAILKDIYGSDHCPITLSIDI